MSQNALPSAWLKLLSDPFAVLGIPVTADERQISKCYRALAKQLHPDRYVQSSDANQKLATAIFTSLINPAYEQVKHTQKRAETVATLRLEAKAWQSKAASAQNLVVEKLLKASAQAAASVYEQAIASYAESQYTSLQQTYQLTQQLNQLNLAYLGLQKPQPSIPPVPTVVISQVQHQSDINIPPVPINYAQRHYQRAIQYCKQKKWTLAVGELRDAIKLEPNNSDFYALLGLVHFHQNLLGMAKVYTRQALKLNPQNLIALKYAHKLKINANNSIHPKSMAKAVGIAALLSKFVPRIESN
ncbi:DnaJ domain-containing protein [Nostoc sp. FACHB-152]|uniref:J domain-containing protein n=1 Tax=unclassified Nostoc TaxID=2593658 RepID=UPI0016854AB5|nr:MULTISPECIES: DnaJ domain-containing protein [unclassified Nostoc]MBD2449213.1 DnaJ domain-containing protein [Nostoc sp. FACHB-152]MBD2466362.1 DnaJ domain-containing protein [Nostoc sp. FACHB-145]